MSVLNDLSQNCNIKKPSLGPCNKRMCKFNCDMNIVINFENFVLKNILIISQQN